MTAQNIGSRRQLHLPNRTMPMPIWLLVGEVHDIYTRCIPLTSLYRRRIGDRYDQTNEPLLGLSRGGLSRLCQRTAGQGPSSGTETEAPRCEFMSIHVVSTCMLTHLF